ncbi:MULTISPECIES: helix-turn-helix domain-containing protein [unclassified Enterococcus]|uniref:helix-turn-helix domain-containing protein n=1 Tax=unclassified Enterococcus TaxID=2608891 RepID=UPI001CE15656|nr:MULTISPECIES: helix-turn-helix transcriptional regulator [unclassified Enterococcus]MCA5013685.1 helix-turn-helix transcriptional regulator [Enterococcus sp. S23]MCA5016935.1 helix-turn-helix transcriptional regulator [Enterococcus sp. S22(2020)]
MITIGANIQAYRKIKHMTQAELAEQLHVSRQTISKWELDKSMPSIEYLVQLSQKLDITLDQLIKNTGSKKEMEGTAMKKALLLVQNYKPSEDTTWGMEAQDYGTRDFLANLAQKYPQYDWRAVTFKELENVLSNVQVEFILVTPAAERFLDRLKKLYHGEIRVLKSNEYAQITLNHILKK